MDLLQALGQTLNALFALPRQALSWAAGLAFFRSDTAQLAQKLPGVATGKPYLSRGRQVLAILILVVGFLLFLGVLVLLWYLNRSLNLPDLLIGPWPFLRPFWLPILFLAFCLTLAQAYALWRILGPDRPSVEFPEIDAAWSEAVTALEEANISLAKTPLFLVLGSPAGGLDALFRTALIPAPLIQISPRSDTPVHVYANSNGIFVGAPAAALLGRQAQLLAQQQVAEARAYVSEVQGSILVEGLGPPSPPPPEQLVADNSVEEETFLDQGNFLASPVGATATLLAPEAVVTSNTKPVDALLSPVRSTTTRRPQVLKDTDQARAATAQLAHLCSLLFRAREPYCPMNGVLLLLPYSALGTDEDASHLATVCQEDLATARRVLKVACPVIALLSDLETAPGFADWLGAVSMDQRRLSLGQAFPLRVDLPAAGVPHMVEGGVEWLCKAFAALVSRSFHLDGEKHSRLEAAAFNYGLYELIGEVEKRQERLARATGRIADPSGPGGMPFAGCFLAATGSHPDVGSAFAPRVFGQLIEQQNFVSWTPEAISEEKSYGRLTMLGYLAVALFVFVAGALIYWKYQQSILD